MRKTLNILRFLEKGILIIIDNKETDTEDILHHQKTFYKKLYKKRYILNDESGNDFVDLPIPILNIEEKHSCDKLSEYECTCIHKRSTI